MLNDGLLQERYLRHLNMLLELSYNEMKRTRGGNLYHLAEMYHKRFLRIRDLYEGYLRDIVSAFRKFQNIGKIEIITSGATHGFLPNMALNRNAVKAQIYVAVNITDCP